MNCDYCPEPATHEARSGHFRAIPLCTTHADQWRKAAGNVWQLPPPPPTRPSPESAGGKASAFFQTRNAGRFAGYTADQREAQAIMRGKASRPRRTR